MDAESQPTASAPGAVDLQEEAPRRELTPMENEEHEANGDAATTDIRVDMQSMAGEELGFCTARRDCTVDELRRIVCEELQWSGRVALLLDAIALDAPSARPFVDYGEDAAAITVLSQLLQRFGAEDSDEDVLYGWEDMDRVVNENATEDALYAEDLAAQQQEEDIRSLQQQIDECMQRLAAGVSRQRGTDASEFDVLADLSERLRQLKMIT
eukprot:TRINITY_DN77121_c0_g1_i1.p1 TRINITY_DN77121_c0_g1~~TRINITY_DN77121_c0_g1_i1.p1  ORF type:complete len:238 (-),score=49.95 TRINITY_DN77121_c0_g1_i1:400-1035(-)